MRALDLAEYHQPGLYDSATGDSLVAESVVDISDCVNDDFHERTFLLFTRAKRGPIVQIVQPHPNEDWRGLSVHFFVDELEREMKTWDNPFGHRAKILGMDQIELAALIRKAAKLGTI